MLSEISCFLKGLALAVFEPHAHLRCSLAVQDGTFLHWGDVVRQGDFFSQAIHLVGEWDEDEKAG